MRTRNFTSIRGIASLILAEGLNDRMPILLQQFKTKTEEEIREIAKFDPTDGKYITWLLKLEKSGGISFPADGAKIKDLLEKFSKIARVSTFSGKKDINQYTSKAELEKVVSDNEGVKSKTQTRKENTVQGAEFLEQKGEYRIYRVTTPEACAKLFKLTRWCTKEEDTAKTYLDAGPLYYVTKVVSEAEAEEYRTDMEGQLAAARADRAARGNANESLFASRILGTNL